MLVSQLLLLLLALFVPIGNPPKEVCSELPYRCLGLFALVIYAIYAFFRGVSKHLCSQCESAEDAAAFSANRKVVNSSYDDDGNYVGPYFIFIPH